MNEIVFIARVSDLCPNSVIIGGTRAKTHELKDIGGDAPKDASNTSQNSLIGVKKTTHKSIPKRCIRRGKLPFIYCATNPWIPKKSSPENPRASPTIILLMPLGFLETFGCSRMVALFLFKSLPMSANLLLLLSILRISWLLIVVYANTKPRIRESLWIYFDGLAKASNLPWLVMGNFNDINCGGNFDFGGSGVTDWIDHYHLSNIGFYDSKFTWSNKRNAKGIIWKQIDKGPSNTA
ncbi:hypothetical protein SADUNF_Sadunf01G0137100 [Salix dunnii]|uniref:Endonuclease/exonuclease/phosphatase domain-containing protein n=1 Tax=Salix dunnii TaxID=1413687 RepID=A0A835TMR0_9ROSI|nr:hypothetical protein SADUNF_Sadunf01G0137100 [Salix dunnii]